MNSIVQDGWVTQLRKGLMDLCVLNVLKHGESHGYEIVRTLQREPALMVSMSTVYPVLVRLRRERLVQTRDVPSPSGPPRRCYSLTAAGRTRIAELNIYWKKIITAVDALRNPPAQEK